MTQSSLTIGQLASHVGVTVRAIRHYHARGLIAEPPRDQSGYRRYDAQAVVNLIRIKTLVDAGVPLSRVGQLLEAKPREFNEAVSDIDQRLRARIRALRRHRQQVAQLTHGERLFLSDELIDILDGLRAIGVSERTVQIERDGWILMSAVSPDLVPAWAAGKRTALSDPDFQRLYVACDEALAWDPDDPRLGPLAAEMAEWVSQHSDAEAQDPASSAGSSVALGLMNAHIAGTSPAWKRLSVMSDEDERCSPSVHGQGFEQ